MTIALIGSLILCSTLEVDPQLVQKLSASSSTQEVEKILSDNFSNLSELSDWLKSLPQRKLLKFSPFSAQVILLRLGFEPSLSTAILDSETEEYRLQERKVFSMEIVLLFVGLSIAANAAFPNAIWALFDCLRLESFRPLMDLSPYLSVSSYATPSAYLAIAMVLAFGLNVFYPGEQALLNSFMRRAKDLQFVEESLQAPKLNGVKIRCVKNLIALGSKA